MNLLSLARFAVHRSWTLATGAAGIVLGLVLAHQLTMLANWGWLTVGLALIFLALCISNRLFLTVALTGGLLIGGARGGADIKNQAVWQPVLGRTLVINGVVAEDTDRGKKDEITLRLRSLSYQGRDLAGEMWLSIAGEPKIRRSDRLTVKVELRQGFGSYAASGYRAEVLDIKRPVSGDLALTVRDWFALKVRQVIDEPMSSLGLGFLTGQRRSLPAELDQALKIAGLTHIVVASGYNLTILVRFSKRIFEKYSRFQTLFFSSLLIAGFIAITGLTPSMMRAGLVTGLALGAWYIGRKFHPIRLLVLAAAITGLITPSYVWGNLGWQLSFLAFGGVMVLAPLGQAYFFGDKSPSQLRQILGETLAATIMTLPLLLVYFEQFSTVALAANMLILPLLPLAMALTFLAGIGAIFLPAIAENLALPAQFILSYMLEVSRFFANLPWAMVDATVQAWQAILLYLLIAAIMPYMWRVTNLNLREQNVID